MLGEVHASYLAPSAAVSASKESCICGAPVFGVATFPDDAGARFVSAIGLQVLCPGKAVAGVECFEEYTCILLPSPHSSDVRPAAVAAAQVGYTFKRSDKNKLGHS